MNIYILTNGAKIATDMSAEALQSWLTIYQWKTRGFNLLQFANFVLDNTNQKIIIIGDKNDEKTKSSSAGTY